MGPEELQAEHRAVGHRIVYCSRVVACAPFALSWQRHVVLCAGLTVTLHKYHTPEETTRSHGSTSLPSLASSSTRRLPFFSFVLLRRDALPFHESPSSAALEGSSRARLLQLLLTRPPVPAVAVVVVVAAAAAAAVAARRTPLAARAERASAAARAVRWGEGCGWPRRGEPAACGCRSWCLAGGMRVLRACITTRRRR